MTETHRHAGSANAYHSQRGATMTEYILLLALIALALMVVIRTAGPRIAAVFTSEDSAPSSADQSSLRPILGDFSEGTIDTLFKVISDPRFSKQEFIRAIPLVADLKQEVLKKGLVDNINKIYGWNLSEDGRWEVSQELDLMYSVVLAPNYKLQLFLAAIKNGKRPDFSNSE